MPDTSLDLRGGDIHLLDLDAGIRTGLHRVVAKFARQRLPPAIENSAILGMSFLADNDIRLVLEGHGEGTAGYLILPESQAARASGAKGIRLHVSRESDGTAFGGDFDWLCQWFLLNDPRVPAAQRTVPLLSSAIHYQFNLAWLKCPLPALSKPVSAPSDGRAEPPRPLTGSRAVPASHRGRSGPGSRDRR